MNEIIINGLNLFAYHGLNPDEKTDGQNFTIDASLYIKKSKLFINDDITETVNYAKAVKIIKNSFCEKSYNLIEKAAEVIAKSLILEFPKILHLDITVKKPQAPVNADFNYMAVKISRNRDDYIE